MTSSPTSFKRLAWIITLLGVALFAGGFIYFTFFGTQPEPYGSSRVLSNQRHERAVDAVQSGMVEIVGAGVAVIGVILLIIAYATAPKGPPPLPPESTTVQDEQRQSI